MSNQYVRYPSEGGVSSLNGLTGNLTLVPGAGITITPSGSTITIAATNAGDVTAVTASAPLASSGGSTPNITITQSGTSTDGYLSSVDWNTFNSKQAAGSYITALTGDGTASGPGSAVFTLSTVNTNVGSFGSSTSIPSFTVNGKGLITAASSNVVIAPAGTLTGTTLNSTVVTSSLTSLGTQSQALNMGGFQINDLANGTLTGDAVNYGQLQAAISGLYWQGPAQAYAASNVPLTGGSTLTIDGYSVQNGNLVILGNQTTTSQNGEYTASGIGTAYVLTPNGLPTAAGDAWLILNGTTYSDSAFVANAAVPAATFTQFAGPTSYTFTSPLLLTGRTVSITQANTSTNGYLSSTDWNMFNNKQSTLTFTDSLVNTSGTVTLVNDTATPGASQYYGTNSGSTLGYYNLPSPGTGTVTSVSVVSANGLAGTVATSTTTPAITLSTTITGVLKGNGTAISAATAGTDYVIPSGSITGTAGNITATSNSTLTTLSALSLPYSQVTGGPSANAISALTGDVTASGPGSAAATLATVNSNVGSFTYSSITVNGKGLITAASSGTAPVTTLAAVGSSPNANAATISGNTLNLQPFSGTQPGVVTASGGGTTNFLRADGTWAAPSGSGTKATMAVSLTSPYSTGPNSVIKYDTVVIDTASGYSTSTGLYTAPATANYLVSVNVYAGSGDNAQDDAIFVNVNGTNQVGLTVVNVNATTFSGAAIVSVTSGESISIKQTVNGVTYSGSSVYSGAAANYFSIQQL